MNQNQPTATETVNELQKQLNAAIVEGHDLRVALEANEKKVAGFRSALNGVQLGTQLVKEELERKAAEEAQDAEEPIPAE